MTVFEELEPTWVFEVREQTWSKSIIVRLTFSNDFRKVKSKPSDADYNNPEDLFKIYLQEKRAEIAQERAWKAAEMQGTSSRYEIS